MTLLLIHEYLFHRFLLHKVLILSIRYIINFLARILSHHDVVFICIDWKANNNRFFIVLLVINANRYIIS